jgi:hypothetical protein
MKKHRRVIIVSDTIPLKNNYNRSAYNVGTRITRAQVAHRIGYLDLKTNTLFYDQKLDQDSWLWLVNRMQRVLDISPAEASTYVNKIYKTKLKSKTNLLEFTLNLKNTCGKLFSVAPSALQLRVV